MFETPTSPILRQSATVAGDVADAKVQGFVLAPKTMLPDFGLLLSRVRITYL